MKKFHFTLARMLEFKTQILDKEKDLLGSIRQKKNEIDQKIECLRQEVRNISNCTLQAQKKALRWRNCSLPGCRFRMPASV